MSKKSCNFAAQNESFAVFFPHYVVGTIVSAHVRDMSQEVSGRDTGHIEKGVLSALFWLTGISQIHKLPKHCSTRCPSVCIYKVRERARTHIHTAWASVLFVR